VEPVVTQLAGPRRQRPVQTGLRGQAVRSFPAVGGWAAAARGGEKISDPRRAPTRLVHIFTARSAGVGKNRLGILSRLV